MLSSTHSTVVMQTSVVTHQKSKTLFRQSQQSASSHHHQKQKLNRSHSRSTQKIIQNLLLKFLQYQTSTISLLFQNHLNHQHKHHHHQAIRNFQLVSSSASVLDQLQSSVSLLLFQLSLSNERSNLVSLLMMILTLMTIITLKQTTQSKLITNLLFYHILVLLIFYHIHHININLHILMFFLHNLLVVYDAGCVTFFVIVRILT